jgi:type III secretion system YscQ/HrcQ family protein
MAKKLRRFRWSSLPHLSRQHVVVMNSLLATFPQTPFERGFKDRLRAALEPALHADLDIWLSAVDVVEGKALGQRLADPCCAAVIGLVGRTEKALVEIDLATAQASIDKLLGGDGGDVDQNRPLSEIEEGVFSFILLKALALIHETFGGERQLAMKLEGLYGTLETLRERYDLDDTFAVVSFKVFIDKAIGVLRLYLPASLVESDFSPTWPSAGPALERLLHSYADRKEMVRLLRSPLRIEVGRLSLAMNDLDGLESDDIVLVEQTDAAIARDEADDDAPSYLTGQVTCRVGDGAHGTLIGNVAVGQNGRYEVAIETIVPEGEPRAMRILFPESGANVEELMAEDARRLTTMAVDPVALAEAGRAAAAGKAFAHPAAPVARGARGKDAEPGAEHSDGYDEDNGDEAPSADAVGLLDDVTVAMVVELGRVMVSAADIMGLRPGQVIELSRSPGEPVDLVVDGKRIGKGELVEIDGELGVRILSLSR